MGVGASGVWGGQFFFVVCGEGTKVGRVKDRGECGGEGDGRRRGRSGVWRRERKKFGEKGLVLVCLWP